MIPKLPDAQSRIIAATAELVGGLLNGAWFFLVCVALFVAGCRLPAPVRGLRPIYPPVRYGTTDLQGPPEVIFVEIDSSQPTLKWEAFPRKSERKADKLGYLNRIERVRYGSRRWVSR